MFIKVINSERTADAEGRRFRIWLKEKIAVGKNESSHLYTKFIK